MSTSRFEFTIDTRRRLINVPLPNRMTREVEDLWNTWVKDRGEFWLILRRANDNRSYKVHLKNFVSGDGTKETYLSDGWSEFVHSNNLQLEDKIMFSLYDMGELSYRVRIWRNDNEITTEEPHPLKQNELKPTPSFRFQFLACYMYKPTINISLPFAREHLKGVVESSTVTLYGNKTYQTTMHIKYNRKQNIVSCNIKKGVQEFIHGENVEVNEKAIIELLAMDPPYFSLIFT